MWQAKKSLILGLLVFTLLILGMPCFARSADLIWVDGSSTVYPITEAVAEEFRDVDRSARVIVGISGSGGGFKKFCRGETDISAASRPIKGKEIALCGENAIRFIEIPVAYDGLAVVVNPKNTWAGTITLAELKKLWEPAAQGQVTRWSQVRSGWPDQEIHLFGPGVDSGTFDYFTEAVVGKAQASRGDFTASEDDNVLVQGISTDRYALGYFGLAYYEENKNKLKLLSLDAGKGPIKPSTQTVEDGTYYLARPLFIYVSEKSVQRPDVNRFMEFYLKEGPALALEVGYVPLPSGLTALVVKRFKDRLTGSMYDGKPSVGKSLGALLQTSLKK